MVRGPRSGVKDANAADKVRRAESLVERLWDEYEAIRELVCKLEGKLLGSVFSGLECAGEDGALDRRGAELEGLTGLFRVVAQVVIDGLAVIGSDSVPNRTSLNPAHLPRCHTGR